MGAEPLTAATSFLSLRRFVEERYGQGSFQRIREALSARHNFRLPPIITAGSWYPSRAFALGMDEARHQFKAPEFHEAFGAKAAEYELHWVYRPILRFTTPVWLIEQSADVWKKAHDTGAWSIESRPSWVRGTLKDFGLVHTGYCRSLTAWLQRACEMTCARRIRVWHPQCRVDNYPGCVFEGEW